VELIPIPVDSLPIHTSEKINSKRWANCQTLVIFLNIEK